MKTQEIFSQRGKRIHFYCRIFATCTGAFRLKDLLHKRFTSANPHTAIIKETSGMQKAYTRCKTLLFCLISKLFSIRLLPSHRSKTFHQSAFRRFHERNYLISFCRLRLLFQFFKSRTIHQTFLKHYTIKALYVVYNLL